MNSVVHFEMPYHDRERAAQFYASVFKWKPQMLGEDMGSYVVVQTAETDEKGMIQKPGAINGGLFQKTKSDQVPSIVIAVEDIQAAMQQIRNAGGTVLGGSKNDGTPDKIPGVGLYAGFIDPEGNRVSILQPLNA